MTIDQGATPGAQGMWTDDGEGLWYLVADGDDFTAVLSRFGREAWQVADADGRILGAPGTQEGLRPLVPGELIRLHTRDLLELTEAGPIEFWTPEGEELEETGSATPDWPVPDAAFTSAFPDALYRDVADEFAPFGTDEGFDAMVGLVGIAPSGDLTLASAIELLYGARFTEVLAEGDLEDTREIDLFVIGVAFGLVWLTGTLDEAGRDAASAAVGRQIERYGEQPALTLLLRDLRAFFPSTRGTLRRRK